MRFMVRFITRKPGSMEVLSLIPAERARVRELTKEGTREALYLAADRAGGWVILRGPFRAWVEEALASLPLHPYLDLELTAIHE